MRGWPVLPWLALAGGCTCVAPPPVPPPVEEAPRDEAGDTDGDTEEEGLFQKARVSREIEAVAVGINDRLRQKLEVRIKRMVGERFDPFRIEQEVALLVDKADVSEEVTRMRSHCDQFYEALVSDKPVGRRLDFLLQEMNREVNTIGSKAAEHEISSRVVDLKSTLERMREQAANVE